MYFGFDTGFGALHLGGRGQLGWGAHSRPWGPPNQQCQWGPTIAQHMGPPMAQWGRRGPRLWACAPIGPGVGLGKGNLGSAGDQEEGITLVATTQSTIHRYTTRGCGLSTLVLEDSHLKLCKVYRDNDKNRFGGILNPNEAVASIIGGM